MRIIIPMAGMGKRMRPHTLTLPKPLVPIAGKPIVHRLVEDIVKVCDQPVSDIAFIIKESFGAEVEAQLKAIAQASGATGHIYYQEEALGTAHAIMCAAEQLEGNVVVAFADTLFKADFKMDSSAEAVIWVQRVDDPSAFGVVQLNEQNQITAFVEKPATFVSDLAIIGIYYFKDGAYLRNELQYLLDNNIQDRGEYQITDALKHMQQKGTAFLPGQISEWLDCGNKDATVYTNQRYLEYLHADKVPTVAASATITNSVIVQPVYIGEGVVIENSVVGPHVSIGDHSRVSYSVITNSIVQTHTQLQRVQLDNSMVGNHAQYQGRAQSLSLGDYNTLED
ncbi:sugar phosphate nucleotidyltransferase [Eisenibacter elegans]|jgi:glucose-1-phosphate thymidylyltransferase|uniref:sugar phosphate nucleotidyltransferase n=1 Tax=Eisenibacter elegans TaxID=997 RepID=UPI000414F6E9|nr:sugar phosphate nucleotidyltransferase [Eisenibacter elegans]